MLHPFEPVIPVIYYDLHPEKTIPLRNRLLYLQAFVLEQALDPDVLRAVPPTCLWLEPHQLVAAFGGPLPPSMSPDAG